MTDNLIDEIEKYIPKSMALYDKELLLDNIKIILDEHKFTTPTSPAVKDSQPKEVVSPVDIEEILNEYFTDKMRGTPRVELERILRKHLKVTTPVEPINQERTDSKVV
jgi:hypothetical protein